MFHIHCSEKTSSVSETENVIEHSVCKDKRQMHKGKQPNLCVHAGQKRKGRSLTQISWFLTDKHIRYTPTHSAYAHTMYMHKQWVIYLPHQTYERLQLGSL